MKALRVTYLNKTKHISVDGKGVVTAIVTCAETDYEKNEQVDLSLGGLISSTNQNVCWGIEKLKVGDTVTIEIIEHCEPDEFYINRPFNEDENLENRKKYVRKEALRFGWEITEKKEANQSH